ncbi:DDE_superfamily endonuclease domain-containing protein [Hexamita inflata]|uniref:DDE superfamily endonuclease domain-containing protein n=1 Tax=Hexamita inflata TaxID=28002 RepID=A0AA86NBQ5_9EUKA|nr:DDE superfamily endonuclease domain-containing protein [Hexamita inflata]
MTWSILKANIDPNAFKTRPEFVEHIHAVWAAIPQEVIQRTVLTMHQRCLDVIKAKGQPTRW